MYQPIFFLAARRYEPVLVLTSVDCFLVLFACHKREWKPSYFQLIFIFVRIPVFVSQLQYKSKIIRASNPDVFMLMFISYQHGGRTCDYTSCYSRFQLIFNNNVTNFVRKFPSSLWRSKIQADIHKQVCKLISWLAALVPVANQMLCSPTCMWISLWTFELHIEPANSPTKFGTFAWKVTWKRH